jgi:transcriptional regulator GlxA family with amidase domain
MGYNENVIISAIRFIEANLKEDTRVADIAGGASYSEFHFSRLFTELTGEAPGAYLRKRRLEKPLVRLWLVETY